MVAINEILLSECTGEECGGETDICTDSRVHCGDAENRAPVTRNHRSAPIPGRWMEQDPAHYINGANTYQFVDSSPVGNVDAEGLAGQFIPGRGTFSIQVKGEPSDDTGWAEAFVHIRFFPAASLLNKRQCKCKEIGPVQVANASTVGQGIFGPTESTEGWHLDTGSKGAFNSKLGKPFFAAGWPWRQKDVGTNLVGGKYAGSQDYPEDKNPWNGDEMTERFKIYAICVSGEESGDSYGYPSFVLRWLTSGPLALFGSATIENAGANPNFGVIVRGHVNWVPGEMWYDPRMVPRRPTNSARLAGCGAYDRCRVRTG